jgi:tetratricopeptide (TPR) repeat protein
MKMLFTSGLMLALAGKIFAADVASDFTAANKFYDEGKFSDAARAYQVILQTGVQSPALLLNYGNAEFKLGNLGKAIAAFRRAESLSPRDSEIRANLNFVRNQVQGPAIREGRRQAWLGALSLNEWAILAAAALWLTFLLLAARQFRPALVPKLKTATTISGALAILSAVALGLETTEHFSKTTAVVVEAKAIARSGPFDDAQTQFTARDGMELSVLDRHEDWLQVADGSGKIGWLPAKEVEVLPGA